MLNPFYIGLVFWYCLILAIIQKKTYSVTLHIKRKHNRNKIHVHNNSLIIRIIVQSLASGVLEPCFVTQILDYEYIFFRLKCFM